MRYVRRAAPRGSARRKAGATSPAHADEQPARVRAMQLRPQPRRPVARDAGEHQRVGRDRAQAPRRAPHGARPRRHVAVPDRADAAQPLAQQVGEPGAVDLAVVEHGHPPHAERTQVEGERRRLAVVGRQDAPEGERAARLRLLRRAGDRHRRERAVQPDVGVGRRDVQQPGGVRDRQREARRGRVALAEIGDRRRIGGGGPRVRHAAAPAAPHGARGAGVERAQLDTPAAGEPAVIAQRQSRRGHEVVPRREARVDPERLLRDGRRGRSERRREHESDEQPHRATLPRGRAAVNPR